MRTVRRGLERERARSTCRGAATGKSGSGYWSTDSAGVVSTIGDAASFGDLQGVGLRAPVSGIAGAPGGQGYWLVARDGGVFAFGSAGFHGSAANLVLNAPVVGIAATPTGRGYWLAAADGGVFTYGDARFYGSAGNVTLDAPVVGIAARTTGRGYWLVTRAAGVRAYGDAPQHFEGTREAGGPTRPPQLIDRREPALRRIWSYAAQSEPSSVLLVPRATATANGRTHHLALLGGWAPPPFDSTRGRYRASPQIRPNPHIVRSGAGECLPRLPSAATPKRSAPAWRVDSSVIHG